MLNFASKHLENAINEIAKLPGIGKRSALRIALHLTKSEKPEVEALAEALVRLKTELQECQVCHNLSDTSLCEICSNPKRDAHTVCVVQDIRDVIAIENTQQYSGVYHVLGGVISPMQGIGPSDLKIDLLADKLLTGTVREVIIAISTSVEGETTLFYLLNRLKAFPDVKVTTIARGIGFGDELEYVDELTITHALINRREI